jgi:S1-C subfamily serine protease
VSNVKRETLDEGIPFGAVIHFTNHSVAPMLLKPWKVGDPQASTGTGFYIGDKTIITNSHVIHNNTSLRLERHGQPGNFAGRVLCESVLCDLAMVTVDDDTFWEGLPSVTLQDEVPSLDDTVVAVGYPLGAKSVTVTRGVVSNVSLSDLSLKNTNPPQLTVQIDAAINPGNSGGPVFNVDSCAVVGVAFSGIDDAEGHGFIIPVPVLRFFLEGFKTRSNPLFGLLPELGACVTFFQFRSDLFALYLIPGTFRSAGIATEDLVNPMMRKSCFGGVLPKHRNGCLITGVAKRSCADGVLKTGDILMAIDGETVSEKCDVEYRGQERLSWKLGVSRKHPGETMEVTVLRTDTPPPAEDQPAAVAKKSEDGGGVEIDLSGTSGGGGPAKKLKISVELTPVPRLLPRVLNLDYFSTYCIFGGLVIIPVSSQLSTS